MITLADSQVSNRQEMSAVQADGSSLWFLSGVAQVYFGVAASPGQNQNGKESYRLLLGPALTGPARAIATAAAATVVVNARNSTHSVLAIEADLDDESGRIQLMFEVAVSVQAEAGGPYASIQVQDVTYSVTIRGTAAP